MNTRDLVEGQTLILLKQRSSRWSDNPTEFFEVPVTIKKILKNRLVIETTEGVVWRLIVEYSAKYPYRNGEVSTDLEGSRGANVWSIPTWYKTLWTTDDPDLAKHVAELTAENTRRPVKLDAKKSLDAFKASLSITDAEAAIVALQAYIKENAS